VKRGEVCHRRIERVVRLDLVERGRHVSIAVTVAIAIAIAVSVAVTVAVSVSVSVSVAVSVAVTVTIAIAIAVSVSVSVAVAVAVAVAVSIAVTRIGDRWPSAAWARTHERRQDAEQCKEKESRQRIGRAGNCGRHVVFHSHCTVMGRGRDAALRLPLRSSTRTRYV
jgi:hypothetical protein